jgi:hypothetical protein
MHRISLCGTTFFHLCSPSECHPWWMWCKAQCTSGDARVVWDKKRVAYWGGWFGGVQTPPEMKFLVPNYSCLQNPWLGDHCPQIPVLCPQLNLLNPPRIKFLGTPLALPKNVGQLAVIVLIISCMWCWCVFTDCRYILCAAAGVRHQQVIRAPWPMSRNNLQRGNVLLGSASRETAFYPTFWSSLLD